jgi:excinuclease ABC subunit C
MSVDLDAKIRHAPRSPGVYLMKGAEGEILYVGKARNLKARIRAYFTRTDSRAMIPFLVSRGRDVAFVITETEKEALILENNLIKEHRPRYNVDFRDDKAYFHIRIDPSEAFPRFQLVRRPKRDGARYFGPYPSSAAAKETLRFLQTICPLRTCRDRELRGRRRPCIEREIGRCAPLRGLIDSVAYQRLVKDAVSFLEGRGKALIVELRKRMEAARRFTGTMVAAALRTGLRAIEQTLEKQRIVLDDRQGDRDVFGRHREEDWTQVCALFVRGGRVVDQRVFPLIRLRAETGELLSTLLVRYYDGAAEIPDEIVLPLRPEGSEVMAEWLTEKRGRSVTFFVPKRGESRALLGIAERNAENTLRTARLADHSPEEALRLLAEKLGLGRPPSRIECFDISNLGGRYAVGSLVAFRDGLPAKEGYRRFRIRTVPGADDYAMMYEVLKRRYAGREAFPDLIVVDGGKGNSVSRWPSSGICHRGVDVIGLAKERDESTAGPSRLPLQHAETAGAPEAPQMRSSTATASARGRKGGGPSRTGRATISCGRQK